MRAHVGFHPGRASSLQARFELPPASWRPCWEEQTCRPGWAAWRLSPSVRVGKRGRRDQPVVGGLQQPPLSGRRGTVAWGSSAPPHCSLLAGKRGVFRRVVGKGSCGLFFPFEGVEPPQLSTPRWQQPCVGAVSGPVPGDRKPFALNLLLLSTCTPTRAQWKSKLGAAPPVSVPLDCTPTGTPAVTEPRPAPRARGHGHLTPLPRCGVGVLHDCQRAVLGGSFCEGLPALCRGPAAFV